MKIDFRGEDVEFRFGYFEFEMFVVYVYGNI